MTEIKTFRDLLVWQKAMSFVTKIYGETSSFPPEELYSLTSQLRRCSISLPSNITEGYGRKSKQDYVRFLRVATGSLYKSQTQLEIALNLKYMSPEQFEKLNDMAREIERMLSSLINKVSNSKRL